MFRIVIGCGITLFGLFFLIEGAIAYDGSIIVGAVCAAIGIAILLNKKEDEIEQIKDNNNKHHE